MNSWASKKNWLKVSRTRQLSCTALFRCNRYSEVVDIVVVDNMLIGEGRGEKEIKKGDEEEILFISSTFFALLLGLFNVAHAN